MAFGKDPGHLPNIPAYGGSFTQRAKTRARRPGRGGGGAFYWKDCYRPPEHTSDIVRLVPGDYQVQTTHDGETIVTETMHYVPFREHHNGSRGGICSAGPLYRSKTLALPCPACTVYWEDYRERQAKKARGDTTRGPNRMSLRPKYAFTLWDYGLYFSVPDVDKNGQIRFNQRTNQPYTSWKKGNPNDPAFAGMPWKNGHLLAWPMPETHFETLVEYTKKIGESCRSCGKMNTIQTVMKICGNPQCNQAIYDPNNCTLTPEQREQIDFYPYTCSTCQQTNYVNEVLQCAACTNPQRATLFDVDLQVQAMPAGSGKLTVLQIFTWSEPRPIQVSDPKVLETIQPLDLLKKFSPTPPADQAKLFGLAPVSPPPPAQPQLPQMQPQGMQLQLPLQPPMTTPQQPMPQVAPPAIPYPPQGTQQ